MRVLSVLLFIALTSIHAFGMKRSHEGDDNLPKKSVKITQQDSQLKEAQPNPLTAIQAYNEKALNQIYDHIFSNHVKLRKKILKAIPTFDVCIQAIMKNDPDLLKSQLDAINLNDITVEGLSILTIFCIEENNSECAEIMRLKIINSNYKFHYFGRVLASIIKLDNDQLLPKFFLQNYPYVHFLKSDNPKDCEHKNILECAINSYSLKCIQYLIEIAYKYELSHADFLAKTLACLDYDREETKKIFSLLFFRFHDQVLGKTLALAIQHKNSTLIELILPLIKIASEDALLNATKCGMEELLFKLLDIRYDESREKHIIIHLLLNVALIEGHFNVALSLIKRINFNVKPLIPTFLMTFTNQRYWNIMRFLVLQGIVPIIDLINYRNNMPAGMQIIIDPVLRSLIQEHNKQKIENLEHYLCAVKNGNIQRVQELFYYGNVNFDSAYHGLAFNIACDNGQIEILKFFIAQKVTTNPHRDLYTLPFDLDKVCKLLHQEHDFKKIQEKAGFKKMSTLEIAYKKGNKAIIALLKDYKKPLFADDIAIANERGCFNDIDCILNSCNDKRIILSVLLNHACECNNLGKVNELLAKGANPSGYNQKTTNFVEIDAQGFSSLSLYDKPLCLAIENENYQLVKLLLDSGASIFGKIYEHMPSTSIFQLGLESENETIKKLFQKLKPIYDQNHQNFLESCKLGLLEKVQEYLHNDIDVNFSDSNNKTALSYAIEHKNIPLIKLLLAYKPYHLCLKESFQTNNENLILAVIAKVNFAHQTFDYMNVCLKHNLHRVFEYLHTQNEGAGFIALVLDTIRRDSVKGLTELMLKLNNPDLIAKVTANLKSAKTILEYILIEAIQLNAKNIINYVIDKHSEELNTIDLSLCVDSGNIELYSLLMPYCNRVTVQNQNNHTIITLLRKKMALNIMELDHSDLGPQAHIEIEDLKAFMHLTYLPLISKGFTLLLQKAEKNDEYHELSKPAILEQNPDYISTSNQTLLMYACMIGRIDLVTQLLNLTTLTNAQDDFGKTALMYAIMYGHTECAKLVLLHVGKDLNLFDNKGRSALFYAIANGNVTMVKAILELGANNKTIRARIGRGIDSSLLIAEALGIAAAKGYSDIVVKMIFYYKNYPKLF